MLQTAASRGVEQAIALVIRQAVDIYGVLVLLDGNALGGVGTNPAPVDGRGERHLQDRDALADRTVAERLAQRVGVALHIEAAQVLEADAAERRGQRRGRMFVFDAGAGLLLRGDDLDPGIQRIADGAPVVLIARPKPIARSRAARSASASVR